MTDWKLTVDGADLRPEPERNKSGRGRVLSGTVTAETLAGAVRELSAVLDTLPGAGIAHLTRLTITRLEGEKGTP